MLRAEDYRFGLTGELARCPLLVKALPDNRTHTSVTSSDLYMYAGGKNQRE